MRKRSIRDRGLRRKRTSLDLDITSLLDILVILLIFLLRSYDTTGVILNIPKDITLPHSQSQSLNERGVVIQVSPSIIWVDDKEILNTSDKSGAASIRQKIIIPLYDALVIKKNEVKRIAKTTPHAKKFSGLVNLIIDKSLKYSYLKKLMHTCAEAGYQKYKFVVRGNE